MAIRVTAVTSGTWQRTTSAVRMVGSLIRSTPVNGWRRHPGDALMTELAALDPNMLMFDARLTAIDAAARTASFVCGGVEYTRRLAFPPFWQPGIVGALHLHPDDEHFDFYVYPDQRLRRALDRDRENLQWWSWAIGEHHFYVRAGIIPGVAGAV